MGAHDAVQLPHAHRPGGSCVRGIAPGKRATPGDIACGRFGPTSGGVRGAKRTGTERHAHGGSIDPAARGSYSFHGATRPGAARRMRPTARRTDRAGPMGPRKGQRKVRRARDPLGEHPARGSRVPRRRRVHGHFLRRKLHPIAADEKCCQTCRVSDSAVREPDERSVPRRSRAPSVRERLLHGAVGARPGHVRRCWARAWCRRAWLQKRELGHETSNVRLV
jgi:hypothetical protein